MTSHDQTMGEEEQLLLMFNAVSVTSFIYTHDDVIFDIVQAITCEFSALNHWQHNLIMCAICKFCHCQLVSTINPCGLLLKQWLAMNTIQWTVGWLHQLLALVALL